MRRLFFIFLLFLSFLSARLAHAQGRPQFITDDPGTPGNHHWEINVGWIGNHNPGQSFYQIPDVNLNYSSGDHIQLNVAELPLAAAPAPRTPQVSARASSSAGVKWRYGSRPATAKTPTSRVPAPPPVPRLA